MALYLINMNDVFHIHEFNHDPLMIAHQIGVHFLILGEQQTNQLLHKYINRILIFQLV